MANLHIQRLNAQFVKLTKNFKNIFANYPVDTAQDAFEVIDETLAPLTRFDREFGSYPIEDKELLYSFAGSIEDLYFLLEDFDNNLVHLQQELVITMENYKTEINNLIEQEINNIENNLQTQLDSALTPIEDQITDIENRVTDVENNVTGNHNLTSSFASFTYESLEPMTTHTITHNMGTFSLVGEPLVMNDDGQWERNVLTINYLDENTIEIVMTEPRNILLNMTAVEYFPSFIYEGTGTEFEINHGLNSYNLVNSILIFDGTDWTNDFGKMFYIDENNVRLVLTNEQTIKLHLMRI